jgi:hypothetical protein
MENKENRKRGIPKRVRFSAEEYKYIQEKIKASPFNDFQNFARILLITGEVKMVDYSSFHHLLGEINRIGNNINQMAKLAHQFDEISSDDIQAMTKQLYDIQKMIAIKFKEELKTERTIQ